MSGELIAVVAIGVAMLGVVVTLGGLILNGQAALRRELGEVRGDMSDLRERMARLEGLFEGFTGRRPELSSA